MSILQDIARDECELEMTPMIDVTFLLLIFFLCTIKFKTLEGKLNAFLPKDVGVNTSQAEPKEKIEIQIRVKNEGRKVDPRDKTKTEPWSGTGRWKYTGRELTYSIGPYKTDSIDDVRKRLKTLHDADPEQDTTIDPRKGVVYADVVGVLDAVLQADFGSVTFVGSYEE